MVRPGVARGVKLGSHLLIRLASAEARAPLIEFKAMDLPELIEVRHDVMMGKPCMKGTRIPVYLILEKLAAGETREKILAAYPQLKPEHLKASLEYLGKR